MSSSRVKLSQFKLNALLELTQLINSNAPMKVLLNRFATILQDSLKIGKILMYHHSFHWGIVLRKGITLSEARKIDFETQVKPKTEITHITYLKKNKTNLEQFDFIIPVFHKDSPLAYVLIGDIEKEMDGVSPSIKHLQFIQTLANIITVAIENKILFRDTIEKEKLKKELEVAKEVQHYLIPGNDKLQEFANILRFQGYYEPHSEIGGDYYDVIALNKEECIFCIGDVSGKGVPAAILMANFQAHFRALLNFSRYRSLKTIVSQLNSIVIELTKGNMFITFFVAKYNRSTNTLEYVNAGHNPPFFYDASTEKVHCLTEGTTGLGMTSECIKVNSGHLSNIPEGSVLMLYTDGLVESLDGKNVVFDTEYLKEVIKNEKRLDKIMYSLSYDIKTGKDFFDDISILGAEF